MKKTLLLCFIHGFKGDDNTFGSFPEYLRALVSHALPKINVAVITYPKFDTKGDLGDCVGRFREWLLNKVIDLEVEAGAPSPTVDPSVRTVLVGHSMGGIVAAETLLAITADQPLSQSTQTHGFLFPYIQGILAFDTPYLGISPGVVAYGAEGHYKTASSTLEQLSGLAGGLGLWGGATGGKSESGQARGNTPGQEPSAQNARALLPPPASSSNPQSQGMGSNAAATGGAAVRQDTDAAATPAWQRWGKFAMFAGAAGAVAAGGAAAYVKRDRITEGWGWIGGHLEFVGCLVKGEDLKRRFSGVVELQKERGIGFGILFTQLGRGAEQAKAVGEKGGVIGSATAVERTFCSLPRERSEWRGFWWGAVNEMAKDELMAHTSMFFPQSNPGYYALSERAKAAVVEWAGETDWYEMSTTSEEIASGLQTSPPASPSPALST
ncbi:MAG: hypothetical protein M1837_003144 [Sclerophora amabilis]|nr:MAG: hypothetical protein M1837_003144 [Sclerophora amabilis]